ncbi:hypothetical protein BDF19DRAFT_435223 [Syncephalis fuscata]|nr:hypothetical protein BDF19DRAFT_435223 [Syncephalis fuscata]
MAFAVYPSNGLWKKLNILLTSSFWIHLLAQPIDMSGQSTMSFSNAPSEGHNNSPYGIEYSAINIAALAVIVALSSASAAVFYRLRDAPSIRYRLPFDSLLFVFCGTLLCTLIFLREALIPHFPCWVLLWGAYILLPLCFWLSVARISMLVAVYRINEASAARIAWQLQLRSNNCRMAAAATIVDEHRNTIISFDETRLSTKPSQTSLETDTQEMQRLVKSDRIAVTNTSASPLRNSVLCKPAIDETYAQSSGGWSHRSFVTLNQPSFDPAASDPPQRSRSVVFWEKYRTLQSARNRFIYLTAYLAIMVSILLIIHIYSSENSFTKMDTGDNKCITGWERYLLYVIISVYTVVAQPATLYLARNIRDNFSIWFECLITAILTFILYSAYLVLLFIPSYVSVHFMAYLFVAQVVMTQAVSIFRPALNEWQQRGRVKRLQDVNNGSISRTSFRSMIDDTFLFNQFKEFTLRDFSIENVLFIEACIAVLAILHSDMARSLGLPPDTAPSALTVGVLRRAHTVAETTERGKFQRKFSSYHEISKRHNESADMLVSCEVWHRLQLIHEIFLSGESFMQVNLPDHTYRQLLDIITIAHASHQIRSRNNSCVCSENKAHGTNTINRAKYLFVTTQGPTGITPTSEAAVSPTTFSSSSPPASPQSPHTTGTQISGSVSRYSFSSDKRKSMNTGLSTSNTNDTREALQSHVINEDRISLSEEEIVETTTKAMGGCSCNRLESGIHGNARPTVARSQSAMAVVCTKSCDNLQSDTQNLHDDDLLSSSFDPLRAITAIEEAREEVETLVMFDTYQRFLLAQRFNLEK